ncbi:disabled homolog 2-interacting protein-like isoform X5 [Dreissena polymorpha]|nr:disabled homolog 2-interacting protein-like isoform X5 [Dreissena polymorpha]
MDVQVTQTPKVTERRAKVEVKSESKLDRQKSRRFSRRFSYSIRRTFRRKRKRMSISTPVKHDTSYEKLVGDKEGRRGSVPAVPPVVNEVTMETPETPHRAPSRFTNFLRFKSNLKRTKSAHKLDRKRNEVTSPESENNTFVGTLKRTMSLGRLSRKRLRSKSSDLDNGKLHEHQHLQPCTCVTPTPEAKSTWSVISSRLKNSQSHESLLTSHVTPLHSIDLTGSDMEIRPLHSSILSQEHCLQVSTMHGRKFISCRTAEEREKWMLSLRKTANPQQENTRRCESSLKVWVQEAKNVPSKRRYFCEVLLDKTLYARTSIKTMGDMLFWGEQFEFNNLPAVEYLVVNLYREGDQKKKKKEFNTLVGYTKIPITDVSNNRQYVERWFNTSSGTVGKGGKENKTDLPLIRLKVRHQNVEILPVRLYSDLSQYIGDNYIVLCEQLEPIVNIRDKEELATTLIKVMQKLEKATDFLREVVMSEVLRLDNSHLTFRGNSLATKSMEAYMKIVGEKYLSDTLGEFVRNIIHSEDDCEVDPTRVAMPHFLQRQQTNLRMYCDMAWTKIITSSSFFPSELRNVFTCFRHRCVEENKGDLSENLISGSIFLRFLCPAILSPSLFHLTQEFPTERAARNLTLIAKTIQTLANFSKFGGKEDYMTFMNDFVEEEWTNMKDFLTKISSPDENDNYTEYDGYIDMGKELSMLHSQIEATLEKAPQETLDSLGNLPKILAQVNNDLKDPNVNQRNKPQNRKSQQYDNLVNIQAHIDLTTTPTELLRDMLKQCGGESPTNSNLFVNRGTESPNGSIDNECESCDSRLTDDSASSTSKNEIHRSEVANVSVTSRSNVSESRVNKSWSQMVSAAEVVNGEFIDLITFMDEEGNHSVDSEGNGNGSQMSISQMSTMASSGYQSFGYSQSSSPIDHDKQEVTPPEPRKTQQYTHNSNYTHSTPLSFSNPMYRLNNRGVSVSSHSRKTSSPIQKVSSNSSLSSEGETQTVTTISPVRSEQLRCKDLNKPLVLHSFNSSSTDSVTERERITQSVSNNNVCYSDSSVDSSRVVQTSFSNNNVSSITMEINTKPRHSQSNNSLSAKTKSSLVNGNSYSSSEGTRKFSLELRGSSSPVLSHSARSTSSSATSSSYTTTYYNTIGSTPRRGHELSNSVDFASMSKSQFSTHGHSDQMRRTATDTSISQHGASSTSEGSSVSSSTRSITSPDDSSLFRRLSAQNAVHMGIRSVQRRIHEQEKSKQEYEQEVTVLKQQLLEAQERLKQAEERLQEQETDTEWQHRLRESEERMRRQQAEKDDQMKTIIQRLMHVEEELREEQEEMQKTVAQKQQVIEAQERRIQSLNVENSQLILTLNQLKEHYSATAAKNGLVPPLKTKLADVSQFKTSSC